MSSLIVCLIVLLALGFAERVARDRAWREVPIRIHVNGTRAKSTVTRFIWAALVEAGIPTLAKTTGTSPRLLFPDGREELVRRRAPANVREQLACLRTARRAGARAAVLECMALDPVLQSVSERDMVRATIGVITNVRFDHAEVMGHDLPAIAQTLANTIPDRAVLITGAAEMASVFRERAASLGTRVVISTPESVPEPFARTGWMAENVALALAVTRELGVDDEVALRGIAKAPPDPGSVTGGTMVLPGGRATWTDATAANDPESLERLLNAVDEKPAAGARQADVPAIPRPTERRLVLVYNHREDRAPRLVAFADRCPEFIRANRLVITGARPPWTVRRRLARLARTDAAQFVDAQRLPAWVRLHAPGADVVFCGNTRGLDVPRLIEEAVPRD